MVRNNPSAAHRDEHHDGDGKKESDDGHGGADGDPRLRTPPQVSQEGEANVETATVHTQILRQTSSAGIQLQFPCSHMPNLQSHQIVS